MTDRERLEANFKFCYGPGISDQDARDLVLAEMKATYAKKRTSFDARSRPIVGDRVVFRDGYFKNADHVTDHPNRNLRIISYTDRDGVKGKLTIHEWSAIPVLGDPITYIPREWVPAPESDNSVASSTEVPDVNR